MRRSASYDAKLKAENAVLSALRQCNRLGDLKGSLRWRVRALDAGTGGWFYQGWGWVELKQLAGFGSG